MRSLQKKSAENAWEFSAAKKKRKKEQRKIF